MSASAHYSLTVLGVLTTAFFAGAGVFQVPAGIFSAKKGATKAALLGLVVIGVFSLASAVTYNVYIQVATRFATGVGAAFFFAPAMVIVSNLFGQGRSGLVVGVYNAAFNLGGGLALLVFTPLAYFWGWRLPYIVTGVLVLVAFAENWLAFKGIMDEAKVEIIKIKSTLKSKDVWGMTLGIMGMAAAYYVVSQFIVEYSENTLKMSPTLAGSISSLILLGGLLGGPGGGWLADKFKTEGDSLCYPRWPPL